MVGGGVALVVLTARSIVGTLIVPRGLSSWISRAVGRVTRAPFVFVADRCTRYETKDRVLAPQAPLTLLALLLCWLGLFLVAYTALVFGLPRGVEAEGEHRRTGLTARLAAPDGGQP